MSSLAAFDLKLMTEKKWEMKKKIGMAMTQKVALLWTHDHFKRHTRPVSSHAFLRGIRLLFTRGSRPTSDRLSVSVGWNGSTHFVINETRIRRFPNAFNRVIPITIKIWWAIQRSNDPTITASNIFNVCGSRISHKFTFWCNLFMIDIDMENWRLFQWYRQKKWIDSVLGVEWHYL